MQISKSLLINILKVSAIAADEHKLDSLFNKAQEMIRELESVKLKDGEMEILEIVG